MGSGVVVITSGVVVTAWEVGSLHVHVMTMLTYMMSISQWKREWSVFGPKSQVLGTLLEGYAPPADCAKMEFQLGEGG